MNNVRTYDEYLKEEFIWSKYRDIVNKLYKYILTADLNTINNNRFGEGYTFAIKKDAPRPDDPYNEETWEEDINVNLTRTKINNKFTKMIGRRKHPIYKYHLVANNDQIDITNLEGMRLYRLIKNRKKNQRRDEERARNIEAKQRRKAEEIAKRERINKTFKNL
jgi:hypothetical protein